MYVDKDPKTKKLIVLAPIPETPAYRAGVNAGDEIAQIGGKPTEAMDREDAISLMRGEQGSSVEIVFRRGEQLREVTLVRESIHVSSVHGDWRDETGDWHYTLEDLPNVGYVRLLQFGKDSATEMKAAIDQLNGKVDGLILDLRNNGGGLLSSATEICDLFIDKGKPIVRTRGRNRKLVEERFSKTRPEFNVNTPLVVLVNRFSASASEIVAGCLQDHGRAVVVGEQTWGKGTVQDWIPMQRNESALKLTVASFWRPSDRNIDRSDPEAKKTKVWGIQPDDGFEVSLTQDEVFENIRRRNRRDLQGLTGEKSADNDSEPTAKPTVPQDAETATENEGPQPDQPDRPLERAKEFFRTLFSKAVAA